MARKSVILIILIVAAGVAIAPVDAQREDRPNPGNCGEAALVEPNGTYIGVIDTPEDQDVLRVNTERGDKISLSVLRPSESEEFIMEVALRGRGYHSVSVTNKSNWSGGDTLGTVVEDSPTASAVIWPEEDRNLCVRIYGEGKPNQANIPYQYEIRLNSNQPEPAKFRADVLQNRISQLQSQLREKRDDISSLRIKLDEKNQTISELKSRIAELTSQSGNSSSDGVTIEVTVTPANRQNFVEGGEAVVQAESENADVSEMRVEYEGRTYEFKPSGEIVIPLADTGTHEMMLVHGDATKQVALNVQTQSEDGGESSPSENGPGFGVGVMLIALLCSGLLFTRYR